MNFRIMAILACLLIPTNAFCVADKAYDLSMNTTANDRIGLDWYVGGGIGTSTGSNINGQNINVPLIGNIKAGLYFNKYIGIEVSGLMAPMGSNQNQFSNQIVTTGQTSAPVVTTTTNTVVIQGNNSGNGPDHNYCYGPTFNGECSGTKTTTKNGVTTTTVTTDIFPEKPGEYNGQGCKTTECFKVTTVTTTVTPQTDSTIRSSQSSVSQQDQSMNVEAAMLMLRLPLTYISFYTGIGPALLNYPGQSVGTVSGKLGAEVPFGILGVFGEEQAVLVPQSGYITMALGGVSIHF